MRTIKKYPNRRLYDTEQSRYITLGDVRDLILEGEALRVVDANSDEDLTRGILLQIINEQESGGTPLFTTDILTKIIRFYGGNQRVFTSFLADSLDLFIQQQQRYQSQFGDVWRNTPFAAMTDIAQRNLEIWNEVQRGFMRGAESDSGAAPDADADRSKAQPSSPGRRSKKKAPRKR